MDTRAIKSNEIDNMKNAIESYTVNVEDCIKKLKGFKIDNNSGFYGQKQTETIDDYIDRTCVEINKIVRYFDDFKVKLEDVREAYAAQDAAVKVGDVAAAKAADESDLVTVNRMS